MRISLRSAHAHLILSCAYAFLFELRMRISLRIPCLAAIEHPVSGCACSSHIWLHMLISFWWIRTLIILGNSISHKASSKFVSKGFETRFNKVAKKTFGL